jgi:hypothetical protein
VHHPEPKAGGTFKMSLRNFTAGEIESFAGDYLDPFRINACGQIRRSQPAWRYPGDGDIEKISVGTELNIVQEGLPDAIPAEACYLRWQESLRNLARLVESKIKR